MHDTGTTVSLTVKPNCRRESVTEENGALTVCVNAPPAEGKANARVTELVARHFDVPPSRVQIVRGTSSRRKVIFIAGSAARKGEK